MMDIPKALDIDNSCARALVERLRGEARTIQSVSSIMVDPRATLLCEAADFIEQSLTPPEGDTVSEGVVEQVARAIAEYDWPGNDLLSDDNFSERERGEYFARAEAAIAALQSRVSPKADEVQRWIQMLKKNA